MKLICPKCQHTCPFEDSADGIACALCGTRMEELLWKGSQGSSLTTATAAAAVAIDQRIMKNQNMYAPSADVFGDDVLEIPRPLRSAQHTGEPQMLVLEDVITVPQAHELSPWDEGEEPQFQGQSYVEDDTL